MKSVPTIEVNIEIYCDRCNEGLCYQTTVIKPYDAPQAFKVEICQKCLDELIDKAYKEGLKKHE